MKICLMGLTASGKSFQAKGIASHFGLKYVSASGLLLERLDFIDNIKDHFWLESTGQNLNEMRDNSAVDKVVDIELLTVAEQNTRLVFDSWTLPWLYTGNDMLRIYLNPSIEARARMAYYSKQNKKYSMDELMALIDLKDSASRERFLKMYDFDITSFDIFDLVFDNSHLQAQETLAQLIQYCSNYFAG